MFEVIRNIHHLAQSSIDTNTRSITVRFAANWEQIGTLNHQELKNRTIANALCDIHHCSVVNVKTVIAECKRLGATA